MERPSLHKALLELEGESSTLFDSVFDLAPVGIYVDHPTRGCIFANRTLLDLWGLSWTEFREFGWASRIHPGDVERLQEAVKRYEHELGVYDETYRITRGDTGELAWIRAQVRPIQNEGKHLGSIGVVLDETAARKLDAHFAQKQSLEVVGLVAGRIAHDFNNLLAVILASVDLMEGESEARVSQAELLTEMRHTVQHGTQITRQLMALSGQEDSEAASCVIDEELNLLYPLLQRIVGEGINLHASLETPGRVIGVTKSQLGRIAVNLAVNARDAMDGRGNIQIKTRESGSNLTLSVTDEGCGMDEDTINRALEPLFTTKGPGRGTGLGLSIVAEIVDLASGKISIFSKPDSGTAMTIELPVVSQVPQEYERRTSMPPRGGKGERILLVDDNDALRQSIGIGLAMSGYQVVTANDVQAARREVDTSVPALLITDVLLPDGNGASLTEELQRKHPHLPAILMTGFAGDSPSLADERQHVSLMYKPFSMQDLREEIGRLLEAFSKTS
ncbi:MAG: ATP-binding protein [Myxococcales bacterium]|nr:ATP-binding protein [Myxococcales bacterium]MDD9971176.1 ATP-binding protein [Myxococcales bacterium]